MTGSRVSAIDGLRGLAALSVFVFHAWLYTLPVVSASRRSAASDYVLHEMRLGLVLFFVLSGFLLFGPWARAAEHGTKVPQLGVYALRRAARIAPAYYLALAGSVALLWGLAGTPGVRLPPAEGLPLFAIFAQNASPQTVMKLDPPLWTIAIEVCFYAVLPLLGWLTLRGRARRRALVTVPIILIAVGLAWNATTSHLGLGMTYTKTLPAMIGYFACGMLAAVAHQRGVGAARRSMLLYGGVILVLADAVARALGAASGSSLIPVMLRELPAAAGFAMIIAAVACRQRPLKLLGSRPLAALGTVSFGLYLWHVPVLLWLRGHGLLPLATWPAIAVALPLSLAIATASWHLVERPVIAWARARERRDRMAPKETARAAIIGAPRPPVAVREA